MKPIILDEKCIASVYELLGMGAEAFVYNYNQKFVMKIFKNLSNSIKKESKVDYLISKKEQFKKNKLSNNICLPVNKVFIGSEFSGYLMKKIPDAKIITESCNDKFVSKKQRLKFVLDLFFLFEKIHDLNMILVDLNPKNFVYRKNEIFLLDCDNWKLSEELNFNAYATEYLAPRFFSKYYYKIPLDIKIEDERNFGFAVLAFEILTGVHPFSGKLKDNEGLSKEQRIFLRVSACGKCRNEIEYEGEKPDMQWLSPEVIEAFICIFEKNETIDINTVLKNFYNQFN